LKIAVLITQDNIPLSIAFQTKTTSIPTVFAIPLSIDSFVQDAESLQEFRGQTWTQLVEHLPQALLEANPEEEA
jgi:hypothetical protein